MNSITFPGSDPSKAPMKVKFASDELRWRDRWEPDPRVPGVLVHTDTFPKLKRRFRNSSRRQVYIYRWDRMGRKGQRCIVHVRGTMNSCLVEFEDGIQAVTSRNALKKLSPRLA